MNNPRAVLFDLDGTLLDNSGVVIEGYYSGMEKLGYKPKDRDFIRSNLGKSTFDTGRVLGLEEKDLKLLDSYFWTYFGNTTRNEAYHPKAYPGVKDLLELLYKYNIPTAICTGNRGVFAKMLMKKLGLDNLITAYVGSEDVVEQKPAPEVVFVALKRIGIEKNKSNDKSIWYVGDTTSDIKAAKSGGLLSIGIPEKDKVKTVKEANPDLMFNSMVDLFNYTKTKLEN